MNKNKKRAVVNILFAIITNIVILVLGLIVPRIMIKNYGSDTNGLIATIGQIFAYLALLESGISTAARNSLYKYIKHQDTESINRILAVSKRYFRNSTFVYLFAVIAISFIAPFFLKTEVDYWTVFLLILFEGSANVLSFYFVNFFIVYLGAEGRQYVVTGIDFGIKTALYGFKILLALFRFNILFIQAIFLVLTLIKLLIYYILLKKKYSWIKLPKVTKDDKLPDRGSFVITEVAWAVFSSTDIILIGLFLSTSISSVYSVYNMVFLAITNLMSAIYNSLVYILGIAYKNDTNDYVKKHDLFNSVFMGLITTFVSTAYLLIIPFVKLYTQNIADVEYVYKWLPLLFSVIQLLSWSRYVAGNLSGLAGYAKKVSIISLIEAVVNIIVSIILINILGIYGVLIGTIVALPIKVVYLNILADHKILKRSVKNTILIVFGNYFVFSCAVIFNALYGEFSIPTYGSFILHGIIVFSIILVVSIAINLLCNFDIIRLIKIKLEKRNE